MGKRLMPGASGRRAVFLDRDGVLNRTRVVAGKPYPPETLAAFELLPGVIQACRELHAAGFLLIVATNQPDVGRGTQDRAVVEAMHEELRRLLPLHAIEVCYDAGEPSDFLKPAPGMLLRAALEHQVDLSSSFMVGDRWKDVECGRSAGCTTLFVDCGYAERLRSLPDFTVSNLPEAAKLILSTNHSRI